MSIVPSNDINPSLNSQDSSIIFLKNIIDKLDNIPHPMSRNERRGSFSANNNQFSTTILNLSAPSKLSNKICFVRLWSHAPYTLDIPYIFMLLPSIVIFPPL